LTPQSDPNFAQTTASNRPDPVEQTSISPQETPALQSAESQKPPNGFRRLIPWIIGIWLIFSASSWIILRGGHPIPEVYLYIPFYLGPGTLIEKLFDPHHTQILDVYQSKMVHTYQSRELSYFFDWIDCQFIGWCVRHGIAHLMSLSFFGLTLAITLGIAKLASDLGFNRNFTLAAAAIPLTSPNFLLDGSYIRSAHFGATACLVWMSVLIVADRSLWRLFGIALLSLCASWFDHQARLLCALIGVLLFLTNGNKWKAILILIPAIFITVPYNYWISPAITYSLHGYKPSFEFQQIPWETISANPAKFVADGLDLFESSICQMLGGIDRQDVAMLFIGAVGLTLLKTYGKKAFGIFLLGIIGTTATLCGMAVWHPPILSMNSRIAGYYGIPSAVLFLMSAFFAARKWRQQQYVGLLPAAIILLNLLTLPPRIDYVRHHDISFGAGSGLIEAIGNAAAGRPVNKYDANDELVKYFQQHR
jgi:hypothetical protein